MKKINISTNKYPNTFTLVDDEDFESLNHWKWYCRNGYAARPGSRKEKPRRVIYMHRVINNTPDGMETDHVNHNPLDNRKLNLRSCTTSQNQGNAKMQSTNTSGYKGVHWHKPNGKWHARIMVNGYRKHIGSFEDRKDAAKAYNKKAKELLGEFAVVNKIGG